MEGSSARATGVHIDRVTQLQDSFDQAGMVQTESKVPVTNLNASADQPDEFTARSREIANDICCQAKKIDTLIESLPGVSISEVEQEREFAALNEENEKASRELGEATKMAHALLKDISTTLHMFGLVTKTICVSAGYLFPAYKCFKLLRGGPEAIGTATGTGEQRDVVRGILKYWVVMAGFTAAELVIDTFMFWMPLVGLVKITFIAWLVMPGINGADIVYDHVVEPYLVQNEDKLDSCFRQAEAVAQRSSSSVSKTAYDKWIGYVQRAISQQNTQTSTSPRRTSSASSSSEPSTNLTGLFRTVMQKMPQASTAATYLAGVSGVTEGPLTQADAVGKSSIGSMLTTWVTAFSSNSLTQLDDDERLRDIRMRKSQLQDMVSQLESNERAILAKGALQLPPQPPAEIVPQANAPREVSGFEEDVVMVGESGMESSSEGHHDSSKPQAEQSNAAKSPSSTSRRWFW
ncbi:hypothetical protein IWW37_005373 [Coemansia sp. RSA 2050]|nr:hypothetical protein IWW37_005373 [Coemansia sp. RSA 2050]